MSPLFGVGFRTQHLDAITAAPRAVDWLEVLTDSVLAAGGPRRHVLERLRADHPLALHGVGLDIAGGDPLDAGYVDALRALAHRVEPAFVSDHLCWTSFGGHQSHDLLPVAYTEEVLDHVAARVACVQERLGRRLFLENPSAYAAFRGDTLDEAAFFAALCRRTGCGMLLDVNNLFVNAANLGVDPLAYLEALPADAVGYLHLAGHAVLADVRIDTHDAAVPGAVWSLFEVAARRFPDAPVIVERDAEIPPFPVLAAEADTARRRHRAALEASDPLPAGSCARREARSAEGAWSWADARREFFARAIDEPPGFAHERVEDLLDDTRPVRAARGMRVYSDAYAAGLRTALATNFPTLARVLRADDFDALAAAYLRAHPPHGHGFERLGEALPVFLRSFPFTADYGVAPAALAEVALLEQAQLEVQHEADAEATLAPEALAAIPADAWEHVHFTLVPALRIVVAEHEVLPAVEAAARGVDPARPPRRDVAYLVFRAGDGVRSEPVDPDAAHVLSALRAGAPFAVACGGDAERGAAALVTAAARGLLAQWRPG